MNPSLIETRITRYRRYADTLTAHGRHDDAHLMHELVCDLSTFHAITIYNPAAAKEYAQRTARQVEGGSFMAAWVRSLWGHLVTLGDIGREDETREGETIPLEAPIVEPSPAPAPTREPERIPA